MKRTYEYRLYPRRAKVKALNRALEQCRNGYEAINILNLALQAPSPGRASARIEPSGAHVAARRWGPKRQSMRLGSDPSGQRPA